MDNFLKIIGGIFALIGIAGLFVLIFTAPAWYIWNHIIVYKFDVPSFTIWEAFWTLLMIRFIIPTYSVNKENK